MFIPTKFPALPILANCLILTAALLVSAGCGSISLIRHQTKTGAPHPAAPPAPPAAPVAPVAPGATPPPPPPMAVQDRKFLSTASQVFTYERKLGALAKQYGNSDEARNLGGVMETEMALAAASLKTLADSKQQQLDTGAAWGHGGLERLASLKGGDFDRNFYEELKLSSTEAFSAFDAAFREVVDGGLKEFAKNWYPILRDYPREAIKLEAQHDKKRK